MEKSRSKERKEYLKKTDLKKILEEFRAYAKSKQDYDRTFVIEKLSKIVWHLNWQEYKIEELERENKSLRQPEIFKEVRYENDRVDPANQHVSRGGLIYDAFFYGRITQYINYMRPKETIEELCKIANRWAEENKKPPITWEN